MLLDGLSQVSIVRYSPCRGHVPAIGRHCASHSSVCTDMPDGNRPAYPVLPAEVLPVVRSHQRCRLSTYCPATLGAFHYVREPPRVHGLFLAFSAVCSGITMPSVCGRPG